MKAEPDLAAIKAADIIVDTIIERLDGAGLNAVTQVRLWMRITRGLLTLKLLTAEEICDGVVSIAEDVAAEARDGRA